MVFVVLGGGKQKNRGNLGAGQVTKVTYFA